MDAETTTHVDWMDILQFHIDEESEDILALQNALNECLATPEWHHDPIYSRLYQFLAMCWKYSSMRVQIRGAVSKAYPYDPEMRRDFIQCIKNVRAELDKAENNGKEKQSKKHAAGIQRPDDKDESGRKCIYLDESIPTIVEGCVDALMDAEMIFQRGGDIVTISKEKAKVSGTPKLQTILKIVPVKKRFLLEELSRVAEFYKLAKDEYVITKCEIGYAEHVMERPEHPYRHLTGITTTPTFRYDGSIIDTPGYDEDTGLFYLPSNEYPKVPESPSLDEAKVALKSLLEIFRDFPFAEEWHRSSAVAAILSIISRPILRTSPLFSVTSTTPGAGKGLLVDVISITATGQSYPITSLPKDAEEIAKRLFSIGKSGQRVTKFDNVSGLFGHDHLDAALTDSKASTRKMREHDDISVELQTVFFVTGNNIRYRGDLGRRIIPITLLPETQNPEERTGFIHKDLIRWVSDNHPRLLVAALTILRAYFVAGKPDQGLSTFGSFEQWSDLVRSVMVWIGMDDPNIGRVELQEDTDTGLSDISELINSWYEAWPNKQEYTIAEVVDMVKLQARIERIGDPQHPANQAVLRVGQALTAYDYGSKGRLSELNSRALGQRMPITKGVSRVIDNLQLHSKVKGGRQRVFWVQSANGVESGEKVESEKVKDSDDTGLICDEPDENDPF